MPRPISAFAPQAGPHLLMPDLGAAGAGPKGSLPIATPQTAKGARTSDRHLETREAFQALVAGTFYKQMLKSLRNTLDKPAYFHGGQAENTFQAQLDQQIAEDLAAGRGGDFADKLYEAFVHSRT